MLSDTRRDRIRHLRAARYDKFTSPRLVEPSVDVYTFVPAADGFQQIDHCFRVWALDSYRGVDLNVDWVGHAKTPRPLAATR